MLTVYISRELLQQLKAAFPERLPTEEQYKNGITSEMIAFNAGIQHCIRYLEHCAELQKGDDDNEIREIRF